MVGGLQGEEWKFIQKYLKKRSKRVGGQILGSTKDHFARENDVCEISQTLKKYSRRAAKLASILRFSASNLLHISGNFRRNSIALCKMAAKSFRSKRVISQPCKILPSTMMQLSCKGHIFLISAPIRTPFKALDS